MQNEEKIYIWKTLGVKCLSSQIARSFLEGRIGQDDLFLLGEESLTISDLFARDAIIREIVGPKMVSRENSSTGEGTVDTLARRFDLFKRIMFRGDDSSASFLSELDAKDKRIGELQTELRTMNEQLSRWQRDNKMLVRACRNAGQAVESFAIVLEAQKRNLTPDSELSAQYREMVSIAEEVAQELRTGLRKNLNAATISDYSSGAEAIEYTNTLDTFRVKTEQAMAECRTQHEAALLASRKKFEAWQEGARQKLKEEQEAFERYKEQVNRSFEEKRCQFQQVAEQRLQKIEEERKQYEQRLEQSKEAAKKLIRSEQAELLKLQEAAGKFDHKLSEEAERLFSPFLGCSRFYFAPGIPVQFLSILLGAESMHDIAAKSVLAFFDCSKKRDGSSGILVTTRCICICKETMIQRFSLWDKKEFKITITKSAMPYFWWSLGIISVFLALFATSYAWWGVMAFIPACRSISGGVAIRCGNSREMTFLLREREELVRFCQAVDALCARQRDWGEEFTKIEKVDYV